MAAWANTGVSVIAERSAAAVRILNEVIVVSPVLTDARIRGRRSKNGRQPGVLSEARASYLLASEWSDALSYT